MGTDLQDQLEAFTSSRSQNKILTDEQLAKLEDPNTSDEEKDELMRVFQEGLSKLVDGLQEDLETLETIENGNIPEHTDL